MRTSSKVAITTTIMIAVAVLISAAIIADNVASSNREAKAKQDKQSQAVHIVDCRTNQEILRQYSIAKLEDYLNVDTTDAAKAIGDERFISDETVGNGSVYVWTVKDKFWVVSIGPTEDGTRCTVTKIEKQK